MRRKTRLPELLAPAGGMNALYAAVAAGADAVYIGGKKFGARAFASNFDEEELRQSVIYCHMHGVRLYVTVNTLIYDREMDEALDYCRYLARIGVDALIVCDIGLIARLRRELPELELHASTQMGVHNTEGADFAYSLGMPRVVLARECSGADIAEIVERSEAECEIFVHGALCVCHSGQCLFSSLVGGRSGNRGECAQPCRLPYNGKYPLSLSDLTLAKYVPEIIASGVASLKIEGRMKSADYVFSVVSTFRRLLDEGRAANDAEISGMARVFSRGGFTDGYYRADKLSKMTGVRTEEDKALAKDLATADFTPVRREITQSIEISENKKSRLTATLKITERITGREATLAVESLGEIPRVAITSSLDENGVKSRLAKLGNTLFLTTKQDILLDKGLNLSPGELNELRRKSVCALEEKLLAPLGGCFSEDKPGKTVESQSEAERPRIFGGATLSLGGKVNTAAFYDIQLLRRLEQTAPTELSRIDLIFIPLERLSDYSGDIGGERLGIILPPVIMPRESAQIEKMLEYAETRGITHALISNIGHFAMMRGRGMELIGDTRMNISNRAAYELFEERGLSRSLLSAELTLPMARDIGGGEVVLGRIPLMLTERCFIKENFGCDSCNQASLTDRYSKQFPIISVFGHRNLILNSRITYMGDKSDELDLYKIGFRHMIFTAENEKEAERILRGYFKKAAHSGDIRRIGRR